MTSENVAKKLPQRLQKDSRQSKVMSHKVRALEEKTDVREASAAGTIVGGNPRGILGAAPV